MTDTELVARLEKLERDNRRLKRLGAAALVLVAALGLIAAAQPIPNVIKAHEFEVVDGAGRVRIRMAVNPQQQGANVTLFDSAGTRREQLSVLDGKWDDISLFDAHGHAALDISHITAAYENSPIDQNEIYLARRATKTGGFNMPGIEMGVSAAGEPTISLSDPQGFKMALGNTGMVNLSTGKARQTSAASIVMFGNDKKGRVIWQAP